MAGVWRHRHHQADFCAAGHGTRRAEVVLHVPAPLDGLEIRAVTDGVLELGQNLLVRLAQHVGHHVEPAAMRHADEALANARLRGLGDDFVENRHEHVESLDREPRLARKRAVEESLERFHLGQPIEQRDRVDRVARRAKTLFFNRVAQPPALFDHEDVRVVVAGPRTVDPAKPFDDVPHRRGALSGEPRDQRRRQRAQVGFGYAVGLELQRGVAQRSAAKRIDLGREMAVAADAHREI